MYYNGPWTPDGNCHPCLQGPLQVMNEPQEYRSPEPLIAVADKCYCRFTLTPQVISLYIAESDRRQTQLL